jgi:hypothetical protein
MNIDRLKFLLEYDPLTGVFRWRVNRRGHGGIKAGDLAGSRHRKGYTAIGVDGRRYLAHRLAWLYMTGAWPASQIDHRDADRRNNAWGNLRVASQPDNSANSRRHRDNATGFKGVLRNGKRYAARLMRNGASTYLGTFDTPESAHAAYCKAATETNGNFARFA